jgi:tellurite resistance protein TerC
MFFIWAGFIIFVLAMLALDLGVFHRKAHVVSVREALVWSAVWIALGLTFSLFVYFGYEHRWMGLGSAPDPVDGVVNDGTRAVVKYVTGYVVEKSLSVDNIFVIAMIFSFFAVPAVYQHRVLFWGILGALVMRGAMIAVGAALIARFSWILYVFGVLLIATAVKMVMMKQHAAPGDNIVVRLVRRLFPVTDDFRGASFFVRDESRAGAISITPLMLALIVVETTDLIFAVDSIPAIFAITADPFLVFTSNVFAILGLRSLYFALAGAIEKFRYLKVSLALVLAVVGGKMLAHAWLKQILGEHFNFYLLGVVLLILLGGVVASLVVSGGKSTTRSAAPAPGSAA